MLIAAVKDPPMLIAGTLSPEGHWPRARRLLRLAGLAAVWLGLVMIPPGIAGQGRGLVAAVCAAVASLAWLVLMVRAGGHDRATGGLLAAQVVAGSVVTALIPGGPAVALPAVGIFDALMLLAPPLAVGITVTGVAAMTVTALLVHAGAPTVVGYTFALAAALLLAFNRRQYMERADHSDQLLAQTRLAQREQARAAALDERTRIAREIHDVLAHSLGALAVQLDVTEALLDDGAEQVTIRDHVSRARRLAVDGLAETRRAVAALRGDTLPLPELLDGLAAQYRGDTGTPARLEIVGSQRPLSPDATLALFRTAQEALNNARKHAAGAPIALRLAYRDDSTVLTVTDHPANATPPGPTALASTGGGYGLTGLRERAALLGGTLHAGPDNTARWTVELRLPAAP
jgi:signal transduction histidine kinase